MTLLSSELIKGGVSFGVILLFEVNVCVLKTSMGSRSVFITL